jgi:hypothetical protein
LDGASVGCSEDEFGSCKGNKSLCPMHKVSAWCKSIVIESRRNENKNFNLMRRILFLPSPFSHAEMA